MALIGPVEKVYGDEVIPEIVVAGPPVEYLIVHGPVPVNATDRVELPLGQTAAEPARLKVAVGTGLTFTVVVPVLELPFASVAVQVMVDVPELNAPLASLPVPLLVVAPVIA